MSRFPYFRACSGFLFGSLAGIVTLPLAAQVVINEISAGSSDRLLRRTQGEHPFLGLTTQWQDPAFDDRVWKQGLAPFGFGDFPGVTLGTDLSSHMQNLTPSLYLRKTVWISAEEAASSNLLEWTVRFNDGFLLFINGREVLRRNLGQPGSYIYRDQLAFNPNENPPLQTFNLGEAKKWLQPGNNVIAIQAHNAALVDTHSAQFLIQPRLRWAGGADIIPDTDTWRYFPGLAEPSGGLIDHRLVAGYRQGNPASRWATPSFDDRGWASGTGPVGIETSSPPGYLLGTNLVTDKDSSLSIYIRHPFRITPEELECGLPLELIIDYDDGAVIYLNGVEIARRNLGEVGVPTPHDTPATRDHSANGDNGGTTANADETIVLPDFLHLLKNGTNILGIQLHRASLQSPDSIIRATLKITGTEGRVLVQPTDSVKYFVGSEEPVAASLQQDLGAWEEAPDSEADWIELFNTSPSPVPMDGWSLTDDAEILRKWNFPAGIVIPAKGYIVVMATGLDLGPDSGASYHHTNFSLSADGEYLGLVDASGTVVSQLAPGFPAQDPRYSFARSPSGTWGYTTSATPSKTNAGPYLAASPPPPLFSVASGFHDLPVSLSITTETPNATIHYTLDGREPGPADPVFQTAISLSSNTVVRARVFTTDSQPSRATTSTYLFNQPAQLRSLPAIMLGGDPGVVFYGPNASGGKFPKGEGIFSIKGGTYINEDWESGGDQNAFHFPKMRGRCTEKPTSFEYLPLSGTPLAMEAGLRISGSLYARPKYQLTTAPENTFSNWDYKRKPSLKLSFRSEFDKNTLKYPFFPGSPVYKFENLRIRAGKNDIDTPFLKDELLRRIFLATGQKGSVGTFTTMFINGVYKGYFNLCEELDEGFMKQHHDSDASWDVLEYDEFNSGDPLRWNEMLGYLRNADLTSVDGYAGVHNHLDVDNFIDYILVNAFAATWDWPNNNWVAARERTAAGRWRFYLWDAEGGFGIYDRPIDHNSFTQDLVIGDPKQSPDRQLPAIYTLLRQSPEFRLRFADRIQRQMFHNGALTKARIQSIYEPLRDAINPVMQHTIGRPVDEGFYNTWIADDTRRNLFFGQLVGENLWPATRAPVFSSGGGEVSDGFALVITNPNADGMIYYTTDGTDPRLPGGTVFGKAYSAPVVIHANTKVLARVRTTAGNWSPVREADFFFPTVSPVFLPITSASWADSANWSTNPQPYPNGAGEAVTIPAPPAEDRNVNLNAPITIGRLDFPQGTTTGRNRVRDDPAGMGNSLTFDDPGGARITVQGTGTGYVEFEVTSGVTLASPLEINVTNIAGNVEHGALRLRSGWHGAGGLTKTGPGVASLSGEDKTYTGPTVVEEGVLQLTEPASPAHSSSVAVLPGGQLRLVSDGNPRIHPYVNPIYISGAGRGVEIPDASSQGKLGALRYEPGSESNHAILTCPIVLTSPANIHVSHVTNRLELGGALSGPHLMTKSGGGTLTLSGDNSGHMGVIRVSTGILEVMSPLGSPVVLDDAGILTGYGAVGRTTGSGHVNIGQYVLHTNGINGTSVSAVLSQSGSPSFGSIAAANNGALLVSGTEALPSEIDIYLGGSSMQTGEKRRGVLASPYVVPLVGNLEQSTVRLFIPDPSGTQSYAGMSWSPAPADIRWTTTVETVDFGAGKRKARILEVRRGGDPVTYTEWRAGCFTNPGELNDPAVSGPMAAPFGDGVSNLMRYALGIPAHVNGSTHLPSLQKAGQVLELSFPFNPTLKDIFYRVEASGNRYQWNDAAVMFDSRLHAPVDWVNGILTLHLPFNPVAPRMFYRFRIESSETTGTVAHSEIILTYRAPAAPEITVHQGTGAKKILKDIKSKRSFGSVPVGKASKVMVFTIKNDGTARLKNLKVSLKGAQARYFKLVKAPARSVAPGKNTQFKLMYKPDRVNTSKATLQIASNDKDENPFRVKLTGQGVRYNNNTK
jgi:autotransporter-associated beta strand protein